MVSLFHDPQACAPAPSWRLPSPCGPVPLTCLHAHRRVAGLTDFLAEHPWALLQGWLSQGLQLAASA